MAAEECRSKSTYLIVQVNLDLGTELHKRYRSAIQAPPSGQLPDLRIWPWLLLVLCVCGSCAVAQWRPAIKVAGVAFRRAAAGFQIETSVIRLDYNLTSGLYEARTSTSPSSISTVIRRPQKRSPWRGWACAPPSVIACATSGHSRSLQQPTP